MTNSFELPPLDLNGAWRSEAKCLGMSHWLFDVTGRDLRKDNGEHPRVRLLCKGCPVIRQCAAEAVDQPGWYTVRAATAMPEYNSPRHVRKAVLERLRLVALGLIDPVATP